MNRQPQRQRHVLMRHHHLSKFIGAFLSVLLPGVVGLLPSQSRAVDWSMVTGTDVIVFYPAQLSWEMLLTQAEHTGAGRFRQGKNCRGCHDGAEAFSGQQLVIDKATEPTPIEDKPGSILTNVKFAHDAELLHVHIEFMPGAQPNSAMDPKFDTKVALMFDDEKVVEMDRGGCYAACHIDSATMPKGGKGEKTMYLPGSRVLMTRNGNDALKSTEDLAKLRADGAYAEYWQAGLNPGAAPVVVDGTILEKRQENAKPTVAATANFENGKWVVDFTRKLIAGAPYKDIVPGKTYTVGFAIHAGRTNRRFHYVSMEKTFALDQGPADFVAGGAAKTAAPQAR